MEELVKYMINENANIYNKENDTNIDVKVLYFENENDEVAVGFEISGCSFVGSKKFDFKKLFINKSYIEINDINIIHESADINSNKELLLYVYVKFKAKEMGTVNTNISLDKCRDILSIINNKIYSVNEKIGGNLCLTLNLDDLSFIISNQEYDEELLNEHAMKLKEYIDKNPDEEYIKIDFDYDYEYNSFSDLYEDYLEIICIGSQNYFKRPFGVDLNSKKYDTSASIYINDDFYEIDDNGEISIHLDELSSYLEPYGNDYSLEYETIIYLSYKG